MSWEITKSFSFCYGHRVWTQKLNKDYCESKDDSCKCKYLHGHEALVKVALSNDKLKKGMVTDFKHLGWLKNFLDDNIDHKFIFDINDPLIEVVLQRRINLSALKPIIFNNNTVGYKLFDKFTDPIVLELFDGIFFVDFTPTSENLARWLYNIVREKMKPLGVIVSSIEWQETPKSKAVYSGRLWEKIWKT